jgi:hypothetical protein
VTPRKDPAGSQGSHAPPRIARRPREDPGRVEAGATFALEQNGRERCSGHATPTLLLPVRAKTPRQCETQGPRESGQDGGVMTAPRRTLRPSWVRAKTPPLWQNRVSALLAAPPEARCGAAAQCPDGQAARPSSLGTIRAGAESLELGNSSEPHRPRSARRPRGSARNSGPPRERPASGEHRPLRGDPTPFLLLCTAARNRLWRRQPSA